MRDIFFNLNHLSLKDKENLFHEAKSLCLDFRIDEKDEHYRRVPSQVSFDEMLRKMDDSCHYVFIQRNCVMNWEEPYLETGFCTLGAPFPGDWFLFIRLKNSYLLHFIDKYKLTQK